MHQISPNFRQRFLSESTTLASCSPLVVSPPTPKIQPMRLDLEAELEELSLEPSEDFESSPYRDFSITFSSSPSDERTVDEKSSTDGEQAVEALLQFLKLGKSRSKSFAAPDFNRSIYGYLQMKRATFN